VIVRYTAPPGRSVDTYAAAAHTVLHDLPPSAVRSVTSYWDTHAPQLVTPDHQRALASITLNAGNADQQRIAYQRIAHDLTIGGMTTAVGGPVAMQAAMSERSSSDLTRAEAISVPITLVCSS